MVVTIDRIHSEPGFDDSRTSSAGQHLTYIEPSAIGRLYDTAENNTSFAPAIYDRDTTMANASSHHIMGDSTSRIVLVNEPDMELDVINPHLIQTRTTEPEFSLPPVDTGKDAWLFLLSAFVLEILTWGFPFAFGIFQEYYASNPPFAGSRNIAIIGTCALGVMYLSSPIAFGLFAWYPNSRRPCILIGLVIMCLSLGLSSLSQTVPHLIVSQGLFYAIGASLCYSPAIAFMDEWFVKRKGLAFGIMWAGTGLGGVIIPLLLQYLLEKYGFRTTLRVWAVVLFVAALPLNVYLRPRLPVAQVTHHRKFDIEFLRNKSFLLLQLGNVLEGFGYFVPSIYLPTYARTLGASSAVSALTLILINVATVFGCVIMGSIVDHWHITTCILLSTIGSTLSVFLLWGFATNLPLLLVFCAAYGFFAGSYTTTYPGVMKTLRNNAQTTDSTMVFAVLVAGRGIGNVVCGPASEALIRIGEIGDRGLYASEYGPLVIFTGISAALGGVSCFGRTLGWF